ncbi:FAD-dependent oxidoreductase [Aestuariibius insulae]|uniref:FAD-dependent oxidoreductase n=1 Tax=Aestuariibius insulae TaxID=2058287 RepID=UPI00345F0E62
MTGFGDRATSAPGRTGTAEFRIAIAGAGIGGLAAAALLADRGHRVTLFDRFEAPAPVGSGLVIQPVGQAVLDEIGAGEAAREAGNRITRMLGHEAGSGRRVLDVHYDRGGGARFGLGIHRASLFDALMEAVRARGIELVSGARVTAAENGQLTLASGETETFDLVVDATGAGSELSPLRSRPLPYGAVWGTVDWVPDVLPQAQLSQVYRKASRMIGVLPCGTLPGEDGQKAAIFWSLPAHDHEAWREGGLGAWRDEVAALWPEAMPFVEQITDTDQMTMARYGHGTLTRPYAERLAIIGDAAHRASPQLGQGANMALLDAMALALALDRHDIGDALQSYAMARRWHVQIYQAMSWAFTPQYQSDSRWLPLLRNRALFPLSQIGPVPRVLTALVCGTMVPPYASLMTRKASGQVF